jgi:hypothetical protein
MLGRADAVVEILHPTSADGISISEAGRVS